MRGSELIRITYRLNGLLESRILEKPHIRSQYAIRVSIFFEFSIFFTPAPKFVLDNSLRGLTPRDKLEIDYTFP